MGLCTCCRTLRVVQCRAEAPERAVPVPRREGLKVPVLLQLKNDLADLLLQVAALLHRDGVGLLGERFPHLGEVAVVVVLVADLVGGMFRISTLCVTA